MNTLPYTLSEYEADPSFQALSTDEKNTFYRNYDAERSSQATSEDDIASIHEERIARKKSAFQTNYKAAYPEDTAIDSSKLEGPLREMYEGFQNDYGEQQHNATAKPEAYRADDIETSGSALSYKPYKFNGVSGYSVSYPDGSYELVPNIADKAQLTEFLQKQRADRFTGKREGWLDKLVGDNELTGIVNKMRNEESGIMGNVGEARKGWEGVKQGFTAASLVQADESKKNTDNSITTGENQLKKLELLASNEKDPDELSHLNELIAEQKEAILNTRVQTGATQLTKEQKAAQGAQNFMLDGPAPKSSQAQGSYKYHGDKFKEEQYKNLFDSMKAAQGIKGSSVMGDFQRYVQSLPKEQRGNNLKDFFWNNPGDILPYIGAVAASSAPDTVAGIGTAAVGTMAGGPIGGATASGSYGMAREYSASLLQGIQERSNEENVPLTPDLIETYMNDTAFMDKIKSKAGTRAGVIGAADAVFGGVVGKIMDGVKGAFKKTALTTGLDAVTEAGGEAAAQVATGEWNTDEVLNEGFGALGTAAATAPYAMYKEGQQQAAEAAKAVAKPVDPTVPPTPEQKAEKPNDIKDQTEAAKAALQARVNQAVGTAKAANGETLPIPNSFTTTLDPSKDASGQTIDFNQSGGSLRGSFNNPTVTPHLEEETTYTDSDDLIQQAKDRKANGWIFSGSSSAGINGQFTKTARWRKKAVESQLTEEEAGPKVSDSGKLKTGRILYDSASASRYEEVTTEEAATMGGGTIIGLSDNGNPIVRRNAPLGEATQLTDKPVIASQPAEDSLLKRSVIARWIDKKYRAANPEVATDPTREGNRQAADIFKRNPMAGPMFDVLSTGMPTDMLQDALNQFRANEHQDQQGALMSVFGITDNDASRRILTNALGNYWESTDPGSQDADEKTQEAHNLAHRLNNVYKYLANVDNIYELNEANVGNINKGDILFNLTPDSNIDPGSDSENYTAQGAYYVDGPESIRRLDTALKQASVVRAPALDNKLNDKFIEASALQRPGVLVTRLADMGADPHEAAKRMNELYPDGWVLKDATGHAGQSTMLQRGSGMPFAGQYYSTEQPKTSHGGLIKGFQSYPEHYQNWYVESLAKLPKKDKVPNPKHQEHRVHLYVDKSGKAHVFRNLTYDKSNLTMENFHMLGTGVTSAPANPNSPLVKALQSYAQRAFTGRMEFADMIFGVDISMQDDGKDTPFVFEANAMTVGMSGWLGNPMSMSELMSVMTGRPSFMTGMYELAKTQLTAEELSVVRAEVNAGMPSEYFSNPEYYRALEQGVALWNKYIPIDSWYNAMQKLFDGISMDFLRKLGTQIKAAFHFVVDPIFEKLARQDGVRRFPAHHGTPHEIEGGFSLDKIGTGEGAQAYGWGLYFTESPEIAKHYRDSLSWLLFDGKQYDEKDPKHMAADLLLGDTREKAIDDLKKSIKNYERHGIDVNEGGLTGDSLRDDEIAYQKKQLKVLNEVLQVLESNTEAEITSSGNVYTVDIIPDKEQFLDLDKDISKQSDYIKNKVNDIVLELADRTEVKFGKNGNPEWDFTFNPDKVGSMTGREFYDTLSNLALVKSLPIDGLNIGERGGPRDSKKYYDKQASLYLANKGIHGNKYLDGNSRRGNGDTYNYVVFDDKLIKIINKQAKPNPSVRYDSGTPDYPRGAYRIDGVQKGFGGPTGDDWVPMYQNVTIIDTTHPYDGSTLTIPLNGKTQLTEEEIQWAVDAKRDQPTGINNVKRTVSRSKTEALEQAISNAFLLPDKNTKTLDKYIDKLLKYPALPSDYKALLEYIKNKFTQEQLSEINVKQVARHSLFDINATTIKIAKNPLLITTVHEIIHAVTSNFIGMSMHNLSNYYRFNTSSNNETLLAFLKVIEPSERQALINIGVPGDFIDLVKNYMSFLNSVGVTSASIIAGEDRIGGLSGKNYNQYNDESFPLPYASLNLDEFLAESMTRRALQRTLVAMPSIVTNAKNALMDLFNIIGRILGIPFNKVSFLSDIVINFQNILSNPDNVPSGSNQNELFELRKDEWYLKTEGNKQAIFDVTDKTAEETNTYSVNGIQFKKGEVSNPEDMTRRMTEPQREILENEAKEEIRAARFAQMKAGNPDLLSTTVYDPKDPNSFTQAREAVTDKLAAAVEKEDADGKVETVDEAKRREQVELLERNKFVAARSLSDLIDKPGITLSISQIIVEGFEYIMNQTVDPDSLSLNKLKYFNNAIESLADEGEAPVGMKHVIGKAFHEKYLNELAYLRDQEGLDFNRPLPDWFRKPFLGIGQGNNSSLIQHATEVAWIGMNEDGVTYLQNLMGTYKQNIELKEIEEETLNQEFYDHIDRAFPKNSFQAVNAHRIGVVARLTQYDKNDPTDPLGQINGRITQLTESLKLMNEHNANKHDVTKNAIDSLGPIDAKAFPDAASFIADLESRLTPREKSTLDKIRDMGNRYHPALKAIKAITRKAVLEDWANYVHDASVTPIPDSEVINMSNLDSITAVLADRKGINPFTTYPELDIRAVMQTQNKAIAYEKHTGVERSILASALKKGSPLSRAIDGTKPGVRPVTDRLRELLVSYHNGMTGSQAQTNGLWSTIEAYVGALAGSLIVGANAFAKNFISSSLSRAALTSIGAGHHMFVYDANKGKIDKFLKDNVPTQARRVGHYDNMPGRQDRWKLSSQIKAMSDAKVGFMKMFMRVAPQIPEAIARSYSDNVLSVLSNLSNARPEKYNASAIWTGAYIKYLQDAGLVTGASDFLVKMPINQAAIFKANEFTSRALGYAPDKASKGSFWNGSSRDKQVLSKLFYMFSQQKVGLTTEFQSNMLNAGVNFASGDLKEGSKYTAIAMANLMNGMAFRYASIGLSSYMVWSGLDQYFDAGDDEERRKAMAEAQRKYTQASAMSNIRDGVTETAMNFLPIANSALAFENAVKMGLDMKNIVLSPVKDNFATFQVHMKEDLQAEVKSIDGEIQKLNDDLKFAERFGSDTMQIAQAIDKLEIQKAQLTEQIKFKYFPSQGYKAAFSILGAYGIAMEDSYKMMDAFTGEDVEDEDKVAMENIVKNEFAYKDNLAGSFYGSEMLMGASNFARVFFPSEWVKKDYEKVPTDVFWKSRLKVFQNPAVVLERGRRDMAKQALKERKEAAREAAEFEARMIGGNK